MSRGFVFEDAAAAAAAASPERPVPAGPNPVTEAGLVQIVARVAALEAALAGLDPADPARARLQRDLRYWRARRANAAPVPPPVAPRAVGFATLVRLRRTDGGAQSYRIVGEDEADPASGLLSWRAPLAQALMGAEVGETIEPGGGRPALRVEAVEG